MIMTLIRRLIRNDSYGMVSNFTISKKRLKKQVLRTAYLEKVDSKKKRLYIHKKNIYIYTYSLVVGSMP